MPKTFLAVNLSEAFTFEEHDKHGSDTEMLEMKTIPPKDLLLSPPPANHKSDTGEGSEDGGKIVNPE